MPALFVYLNIFHCSWIVFLHAGHSREDAGLLLLSAGWVLFIAFVRLNVEMQKFQLLLFLVTGLCSNENCPYRHVNVNANASICEGFLKGYCADGNEVLLDLGLEVLFYVTSFTLHLLSRKREGEEVKVEGYLPHLPLQAHKNFFLCKWTRKSASGQERGRNNSPLKFL